MVLSSVRTFKLALPPPLSRQIPGLRVDPDNMHHIKKAGDVYARTRSLGFGQEVQRRILLGTYALTAEYV